MAHFSIGDGLNQKDVCENETQLLPEPEYITNLKRVVVREAYELFLSHFGVEQSKELRAAVAPGRVNLIGEHIDYCDGFVLPMAIPLYTAVLGRQVKDQSRGYSLIFSSHFNQTVEIKKPYEQRCDKNPAWSRYMQGVLALSNCIVCLDIVVHSHIPPGSGLSSSAALELATYHFISQFGQATLLSPVEIALMCRRAEHEFATVPCGIMDQFVISLANHGYVLKIDCRSLDYDFIPVSITHDTLFLVTNSGVQHSLAGGEYAKRRATVDHAVQLMGVGSWRDVSHELIQSLPGLNDQDMVENATHIVDEIERTIKASKALLDNNIIQFGKLMLESHVSLRDRYRVSCLELDQLVDLAMECEGVFGSRMTGGGFGGCTVTLVKKDKVGALKEYIKSKYTGGTLSFYGCEPVGGASTIGLAYLMHTK